MGDVYSYSRINTFVSCPHAYHRRYILNEAGESNWFAELGTLVHQIHEDYYKVGRTKNLSLEAIRSVCLLKFEAGWLKIESQPPFPNIKNIRYKQITEYFSKFVPDEDITQVEEHFEWTLKDGSKMQGYIDEQTKSTNPNHSCVGDIKSKYDEKYDRQLDTYCIAFEARYGKLPNFVYVREYTTGNKEIFKVDRKRRMFVDSTHQWLVDTISEIEEERLWLPKGEKFLCNSLCDYRNSCKFKVSN